MILSKKQKLLASEMIRIIATVLILYKLNIPIYMKILLIILADLIDCDFPRLLFGINNWIDCKEIYYQIVDKITDTICYTLLLIYILNNGGLSSNYNNLLIILFLYRFIGTYLFIIKNERKFLFYFPNFFLEICLGLFIINDFPRLTKYKGYIVICIIIYKIIQEYYLHIYKVKVENKNNNLKN